MAREPTTWVKLNRNILEWRWFKDSNTLSVFLYLLLSANTKDAEFKGITIHRGEIVRTQEKIAEATGLTRQKVRTVLCKLLSTKELTKETRSGIVVISIPGYDRYQKSNQDFNQAITTNKERKEIYITNSLSFVRDKSINKNAETNERTRPYTIPKKEDVIAYAKANGLNEEKAEAFYDHYEAKRWKTYNGNGVYDWKAVLLSFTPPESKRKKDNRPKTFTDADGITYELIDGQYEVMRK